MADKETFQKEIRATLKGWSRIIDELRAEGEDMDKPLTHSRDFNRFCKKGITIYETYSEARRKIEEFAKSDDAAWEEKASEIENVIKQLDHLWETRFAQQSIKTSIVKAIQGFIARLQV